MVLGTKNDSKGKGMGVGWLPQIGWQLRKIWDIGMEVGTSGVGEGVQLMGGGVEKRRELPVESGLSVSGRQVQ